MLDPSAYAKLVEELGEETAQELHETFIADRTQTLPTLPHLAKSDRAAMKREAHTLKSTAGTFGFFALAGQALEIGTYKMDLHLLDLSKRLQKMQAAFDQSLTEFGERTSQQANPSRPETSQQIAIGRKARQG